MFQSELLLKLRTIVADLEQRQLLIKHWITSEDPELVLLGRYQREIVNWQKLVLEELIMEIRRDGLIDE